MSMTTVFVCVPTKGRPYELARDARDPTGDAQAEIERLADTYSRGRLVRVHVIGPYIKPWRQQADLDVVYESYCGHATPDYRTVSG